MLVEDDVVVVEVLVDDDEVLEVDVLVEDAVVVVDLVEDDVLVEEDVEVLVVVVTIVVSERHRSFSPELMLLSHIGKGIKLQPRTSTSSNSRRRVKPGS